VRNASDGVRELAMVRWGMPSPKKALLDAATKRADKLRAKGKEFDFNELLRMEPDGGTTNVRNTSSAHWKPWLGIANRCVVPLTSFSEFDHGVKQDVWFALSQDRPLAFFAGIWTAGWTGVRKIKTVVETADLFAFLTTEPNREVGAIHPKAMPVILTEPEEIEAWMTAPWEQARALQRPLPDGALVEVARGVKKDEAA
jgi:putative SOS response-associated peptidase YedK